MSKIFNPKFATFLASSDKFITNLAQSQSPTFLGIAKEEQERAKALHTELSNAITACDDAQLLAKQTTLTRDAAKKALDEVLQSITRRVKSHPELTPATGASLGLESTRSAKSINLSNSASQPYRHRQGRRQGRNSLRTL